MFAKLKNAGVIILIAFLLCTSVSSAAYASSEETTQASTKASLELKNIGGFTQRFLRNNSNEYMGITKDMQGFLHVTPPLETIVADPDISGLLKAKTILDKKGIPMLFVLSGSKDIEGYTTFSSGKVSTENLNMDYLTGKMSANGITVLDLRKEYTKDLLDKSSLWYITDHHWRVETAFYAYGKIINKLNSSFGINFDSTPWITNINNYEKRLYPKSFLGSCGIVTGKYFAGIDDFTLIVPKFQTSYTSMDYYRFPSSPTKTMSGSFEDVLIEKSALTKEAPLTANKYASYLAGDYPERTITNHVGKGKYLVVQDSFGLPLSAFLSLSFNELTVLDLRQYNFNTFEQYLSDKTYDGVIFINQLPK